MAVTSAMLHTLPSHTTAIAYRHTIPLSHRSSTQQHKQLSLRRGTPYSISSSSSSLQSRAALPVISAIPVVGPITNFVTNPFVLSFLYLIGAIRFVSGFSKTTFSDTLLVRFGLAAIWPVLFVISKRFRENFKKAVT